MSLSRVVLVVIQAAFNEMACTPPNPTPEKGKYHTDTLYIIRIAPLILRIHQLILRLCTAFEILLYLSSIPPFSTSPYLNFPVFSTSESPHLATALYTTPLFTLGVVLVALGASIRLSCFHALGELFTFDLTILPSHRLVTSGLYAWVRHPAYTGSLTIVAGLAFSHLSPGSWLYSFVLQSFFTAVHAGEYTPWGALALGAVWWLWTLGIGLSRVEAEDRQMRALFREEWDAYAVRVPCWFIPGVI
ncbi:hypothetical protein DFH06DRAFT_1233323 [Mycena polygramma]|nr:hypothetical protein DFH06DRAFT_1245667 [Mycena polygramma]KAJ7620858.1 hypothetical protein DFH06DRAFT_1233323 [Mycena polygramma]